MAEPLRLAAITQQYLCWLWIHFTPSCEQYQPKVLRIAVPARRKTRIDSLLSSIKENSILNVLLREKKQIETSLENIMAAIEQGVITNTTTKRLKELEARQEELDRQILIERSKNAVRVSAEEIREYYKAALSLEAQMLVNYLVKDIVLYDDKIEIYFNKPTRTSPDENRGFSVFTGTADSIEIEIII